MSNLQSAIYNLQLRRRAAWAAVYLVHSVLCALFLLPFVWALATSLQPPDSLDREPAWLIPAAVTLRNYIELWTDGGGAFQRNGLNSLIVSFGTVGLVLAASTPAGYSFARLSFRGKGVIFLFLISAILIPFQVLLVPLFNLMSRLGLINTYAALILIYSTFLLPFAIFMMRVAFASVPVELHESAMLDGASEWRAFRHVMVPLALPALATVAIYSFYVSWNEFLVALVFTNRADMQTLTVSLQVLAVTKYGTHWEKLMAGTIISFVPVMLLFIFLQRYFIRGMLGGALKG